MRNAPDADNLARMVGPSLLLLAYDLFNGKLRPVSYESGVSEDCIPSIT